MLRVPFSFVVLCSLLLLLPLLPSCSAIQFFIKQGEETCLRILDGFDPTASNTTDITAGTCNRNRNEDVIDGQLLIGDYTIIPSDGRVSVSVSDPVGNVVYTKSVQSDGKFAHTASKAGEYRMCFHNSEGISQKTITLTLSSGGKDLKEMAKKDTLKPIEIELKRLEDAVTQIHAEMKVLQEREQVMRVTNDSTANRVIWFSVASMLVLVALNAGQILYLKQFFQAKKLIQ